VWWDEALSFLVYLMELVSGQTNAEKVASARHDWAEAQHCLVPQKCSVAALI